MIIIGSDNDLIRITTADVHDDDTKQFISVLSMSITLSIAHHQHC